MSDLIPITDRNFDDLADRFQRNISQTLKGRIRNAVIERDLAEVLGSAASLDILDAGGGCGDFSLNLAVKGHQLTICDISARMLEIAKTYVREHGLESKVNLLQMPLQEVAGELARPADLVLCHAALEWLAEPREGLRKLMPSIAPGGYLSLAFYNLDGLIYKNLLRTNFRKIEQEDMSPQHGSLTPVSPLRLPQLLEWIEDLPLQPVHWSGIRVIHDYVMDPVLRSRDPETMLRMELEFSRRDPYRALGRYIHILLRRDS